MLLYTMNHVRGSHVPHILSMRERAQVFNKNLAQRLEEILPLALREQGLDMWLILCQEDDLDPVFKTMIPMDTWCPILQMLVFYDRGDEGIERINLSFTDTKDMYDTPWPGRSHHIAQWEILKGIVEERDPMRIGINIGEVQWAAGGLTYNLYKQLTETLPRKYVDRLESAEPCATRWLTTLTDEEIALYEYVVRVSHSFIAECYSPGTIIPGVTTVEDLVWGYWQLCADNGIKVAFNPFFVINRDEKGKEKHGDTEVIHHGDFIRCDVGIEYLGLITDHQEWAYVLKPGEKGAPEWAKRLMSQGNKLQDCFMGEFKRGLTGNQLLSNILNKARANGIPNPKIYSHGLGRLLHEPGPLIGLPWEQEWNEGRGDVRLEYNYAFTMELSVEETVPEWDAQSFRLALEQNVVYTSEGCRAIDGRQTSFHLI